MQLITTSISWPIIFDILKDSLLDSLLVFGFVFLFHLLLSFIEDKLAKLLTNKPYRGPLFGSVFGLIPQCGTSVLASDLYAKRYITLGTIIAVFLSCSDEALIVLLTSWNERTILVLPLIGIKFAIGLAMGYAIDTLLRKKQKVEKPEEEMVDVTCQEHHHEHTKVHKHLLHPLVHSLEIFIYVLIINFIFGLIFAAVGEEEFVAFLHSNRYLSPLFASIIGLIPNCASSVFLSEMFVGGYLSFGALLAGLLVNSGLGIMILLKKRSTLKDALIILCICFVVAVISGYITCLIAGF